MAARRTLLMTPGDRPELVDKARHAEADVIWLDLEDAVPKERKSEATTAVCEALRTGTWACGELLVRVNQMDGRGPQDITTMMRSDRQPAGFVLSKVRTAEEVAAAANLVTSLGTGRGTEILPSIWVMVETPQAVLNIESIAGASPAVEALLFGGGALRPALGLRAGTAGEDVDGLLYARSRTILAARAFGLTVFDGAYDFPADIEGTERDARRSFALGFDGKLILSPRQIRPVHDAWAPDKEELRRAGEILEALANQTGGVSMTADRKRVIISDTAADFLQNILTRARVSGTAFPEGSTK